MPMRRNRGISRFPIRPAAGQAYGSCLRVAAGYTGETADYAVRDRLLSLEVVLNAMDSNAIFAILLLLAGIGILTAEVFIPSGGLLGVVTFLTLVVSIIFAHRAWGTSNPNIFWAFCASLLVLVPSALIAAFYVLPRTAVGKRILLEGPNAEELTPFADENSHRQGLVGQFGRCVSPLTPGGLINVKGERLHAMSEGLILDAGQWVEVVEVQGARLLVRPANPPAEGTPATSAEQSSRLDFEFPQS